MEAVWRKNRNGFKLPRSDRGTVAHKTRMGFNLIESAIVLGVVGLVVAGIWYAASALSSQRKVDKAVEYLTVIEQGTRTKMPIQEYSGTGEAPYNHKGNILAAMNIIPKELTTSNNTSISSEGIRLGVRLEDANVWSVPDGPSILIDVFTEIYGHGSTLTISECTSLIKKVLSRNKNNPFFYKINVFNPDINYTRSSNINSVVCPSTATQIYFIFRR